MAGAAKNMKRVTLELGGKSANVIFADSDLEKAAAAAPYAVFRQLRPRLLRALTHSRSRNAYDRFMELFESAVKNVVVGDPNLESTEMGPLISRRQLDAVKSFVPEDAPIAFQGSCPTGPGFWFPQRCWRRSPPRTEHFNRRFLDPSLLSARSQTKLKQSQWPTIPITGFPVQSGPTILAKRSGSPEQLKPATCRSTRIQVFATGHHLVVTKNQGSAANSDPTPWMLSPKLKTYLSAPTTKTTV